MAYAPAGSTTQTATLTHLATVFYAKYSLDRLTPMFRFASVTEPHPIPLNSGKTIQFKRYALPGFNTTPAAEGVIGTPVQQASTTLTATVEQYSDFMSASTLLMDTDISDTKNQMVEDLSYRAAGTVDTIIRTEIDSLAAAIATTQGSFLGAVDSKAQVALMEGINIKPFENDRYRGICHPYVVFDMITDNTAGGFIDALKYASGQTVLNGEVGEVGRVRWLTSTNVAVSGTAPSVLYSCYIHGKGGVGMVDLAGRGPNNITDPQNERFNINFVAGGPNPADPVGEIAGFASYRFVFAAKLLDTVNPRYRRITADASLI